MKKHIFNLDGLTFFVVYHRSAVGQMKWVLSCEQVDVSQYVDELWATKSEAVEAATLVVKYHQPKQNTNAMLTQLTTTKNGRTYVDASDVREFLQYINQVDPGRFVVARGRLWYFCDNSAEWIQCDAFRSEYTEGLAVVYSFDVTDALNPEAQTIDLY